MNKSIDLSLPSKYEELTINMSARQGRRETELPANWFSMDNGTGIKIICFHLNEEPIDLTDVENIIIGFDFVRNRAGKIVFNIEDVKIVDAKMGKIAVTIPTQVNYTGRVFMYPYIVFNTLAPNGRPHSLDGGAFVFNITQSWIDDAMPCFGQVYIPRFDTLLQEFRLEMDQVIQEAEDKVQAFHERLNAIEASIGDFLNSIADSVDERVAEIKVGIMNDVEENTARVLISEPTGLTLGSSTRELSKVEYMNNEEIDLLLQNLN